MKRFICTECGSDKFIQIVSAEPIYSSKQNLSFYELMFFPRSMQCYSCKTVYDYPLDTQHFKEYE